MQQFRLFKLKIEGALHVDITGYIIIRMQKRNNDDVA
jgi:hypothetical protein